MAQTKRKRQTKHRGNAAGSVTSRGRTSRPVSGEARKQTSKAQARNQRLNKKPTWESVFKRSIAITMLMLIFLLITSKNVFVLVAVAIVATAVYVPLGYYMDTYMWRRRMAKQGLPTE
jgi:Flp pilus assembly protein TadB